MGIPENGKINDKTNDKTKDKSNGETLNVNSMAESANTKTIKAPPAPTENPAPGIGIDVLARRAAVFYEQGHLEAARQLSLEIATRYRGHVETLLTLAHTLRDMGRFDEAITVLQRIARIDRDNARAHAAYALTLFYKEDWTRAWRAYDVRFKLMESPPQVTVPDKDGKPVKLAPWRKGPPPASLLVLGEQGLGDTIMFARFLPLLTQQGVKITAVVQGMLFDLLKTLDADIEFRPIEKPGSVRGIKGWTPLMHLPQALGLTPEQFIPKMPYLRAEPERVARRKKQLGKHGFKVGIVWQGNYDPRIDQGRSAPLSAFAPLAEIPGVRLISLQRGKAEEDIGKVAFGSKIENPGADIDLATDGFRETAALVEAVDLVVSVDTSVAHVAGALNKPVIIMIKRLGSDWRWLYGRSDTVWYPAVRLLRQAMPGDWTELLARVAQEVRQRAKN
ncbi:MAG: tetratricopeptide repeat protein [Pseudolabrys sp.]